MIRVIFFLAAVAIVALGVAWFADRPGEVAITWQGWRIETTLMVLASAVLAAVVALIVIWSLARGLFAAPRRMRDYWQRRRGRQGYLAISQGLIAIGAGDAQAARKASREAERLAPDEPLTLLLGAQAAQLAGDRAAAEQTFRKMAARDGTKLLGLRGLFVEAQRREDAQAAKLVAEEAVRAAPALPWAGQAVLQLRGAAGDWDGALDILERNRKTAALDKAEYTRKRAVLLTAQALSLEQSDRDRAKAAALEAVKLAPDFVPAAVLAGRFLAEAGDLRKASKIIRTAWAASPHPDLAETYVNVRFGDTALERLARARALASERPEHSESGLAVAQAALDAREFKMARDALAPLLDRPTRRVAMLMAQIERTEHGDEGRAREWMARALNAPRDPAWIADGFVSERWLPMSPVSGRLDAFEWRSPQEELPAPMPVDEAMPEIAPNIIEQEAEPRPDPAPKTASDGSKQPAASAAPRATSSPPAPAIVVPVVPAPDDPGPEPDAEPGPEAPAVGWRALFR